jgi:hypothetical protein
MSILQRFDGRPIGRDMPDMRRFWENAMSTKKLHCCGCLKKVNARLTDGKEIYPHRPDLYSLPFWKCDACGNFVGCHHKTKNRTNPLGDIPTKEIKNARQHIHKILDPLWQSGAFTRKEIYEKISLKIGREYHTAQIRSIEEARQVYEFIRELKQRAA